MLDQCLSYYEASLLFLITKGYSNSKYAAVMEIYKQFMYR